MHYFDLKKGTLRQEQELNLRLTQAASIGWRGPTPVVRLYPMRHRLQIREEKAVYVTGKSTVETVFGIIKQVQGFRQFLLRGLDSVQSKWSLVCIG